jgi:NodT family efflux transporter outer membrane factor (OMF) lipoprotein
MNRLTLIAPVLFFSSCAVGPEFLQPHPELPKALDMSSGEQTESASLKDWWNQFNDPQLTSLVTRSVEGNLDLKQAALRIESARESVTISTSRFFPQIEIAGGITRTSSPVAGGENVYRSISSGGLDSAWEIDLFGGIRRDRESSLAFLESTEESFNGVRLELVSEVATNYIQLRAVQERLRIINETISIREHRLSLVEQKYLGGLTDAFDYTSAKADLESLRAQNGPLTAQRDELTYAIGVLLGKQPEEIRPELLEPKAIPNAKFIQAFSLPAEAIERRPDIRRAIAELHAQTALVGVATAALYPRVSMSGNFTFQHTPVAGLSGDSHSFGFGPTVSLPIFNAGRLRAQLSIQENNQEIAFQSYKSTVLQALKETETALVRFGTEQQRRENLKKAVEENEKAVAYALQLFQGGLADYFRVIQAQAALLTAQQQLVDSEQNVGSYLISVYKSVGGGWE